LVGNANFAEFDDGEEMLLMTKIDMSNSS